jgi:hypothetical protein
VYRPPGEIVPQAAPLQPVPATLQEITRLGFELAAGVSVAAKAAALPAVIVDAPVTAKEKELVTAMFPVALLDGSATLTAVSERFGGEMKICGAVYVPEESTVPHAAPVHPLPESIQVTERLGLAAEFTVAVNGRKAPSSTGIATGETETEMSLVIVTIEAEVLELSAALVACTETEAGAGRIAGAV